MSNFTVKHVLDALVSSYKWEETNGENAPNSLAVHNRYNGCYFTVYAFVDDDVIDITKDGMFHDSICLDLKSFSSHTPLIIAAHIDGLCN